MTTPRFIFMLLATIATITLGACDSGSGSESSSSGGSDAKSGDSGKSASQSAFVGSWELDKDATKAAMEAALAEEDADEGQRAMASTMFSTMLAGMSFDVEIRKDNTFDAEMVMGDKTEARRRMQAARVPIVPGLVDPLADAD